jgi:hypothetical protein
MVGLPDEDAALAEMLGLLIVGFLKRQRASRPPLAVEKFPFSKARPISSPAIAFGTAHSPARNIGDGWQTVAQKSESR